MTDSLAAQFQRARAHALADHERVRMRHPVQSDVIDRVFHFVSVGIRDGKDTAARLAAAERVSAAMAALDALPPPMLGALGARDTALRAGRSAAQATSEAEAAGEETAWTFNPLLAEVHAAMQQHAEARAAAAEAGQRAEAERVAHDYPAILLRSLRERGIPLALSGNKIAAPAGIAIGVDDAKLIQTHRDGLVAALRAEAEAARPQVVA